MVPTKDEELLNIAKEIRDALDKRREQMSLSFVEDTHTYYIKDKSGEIVSNFPSVSTVIKQFYEEFDDLTKSYQMCDGNLLKQDDLLKQWRAKADYANNKGSRVHFLLETDLLKMYNSDKEVRKPIFECNDEQIYDGNQMIDAGHDFIRSMHRRGAVLLDTEIVLGSVELGYTGQPDKVWLIRGKDDSIGIVVTDWKTNLPKNFEVQSYTGKMLPPFENENDTQLEHYKLQLPLYGRLLLDMLKGTKFEDIKFYGCVIVHLLKNGTYGEYRVENRFIDEVMTMDPLPRIDEVFAYKKKQEKREIKRKELVKKLLND